MEKKLTLKDELTEKIGVLARREIEARIIVPFVEALKNNSAKRKYFQYWKIP